MKVRALTGFVSESGTHEPGDVFEMDEKLAGIRSAAGLVAPVRVVEEAVAREPERAVSRPKKKGR